MDYKKTNAPATTVTRNLTVTQLEQRLQELLPYRARRDTAVSSVPDTTGFVKRSSI